MHSEFDECFQTVGVMNAQYCCGMTKITWDYFRNGSPYIVMKLTIHTNTQNTPKKFHSNSPEGGTIFFFFLKEQNIIIKLCLKKKNQRPSSKTCNALWSTCSVSCAVWVLSTHWKKEGDKKLLVKDTVHFICIGCLLLDTLYYTVITSHPVSSTSRSLLLVKCVIVLKYLNSYCSTKNTHSVDQAKYFVGLLEFA